MTDRLLGENNNADETLEPAPGAQVQQDAPPVGDSALPSGAEDNNQDQANEPATMEDAIAAALAAGGDTPAAGDKPSDNGDDGAKGDKGDAAPAKADEKSDATAENGDDNQNDDDPSEDDLKALRPNVQKRVKKLLHQRNEARREAEGLRGEAEEYRNIRTFVDQNNLEDSEVADLFKFGAMVKSTDPAQLDKALELVMPIVRNLMVATGRSVPDDLRAKVDSGELTEEMARQVGKERFKSASAQRTAARTQQQFEQREAAAQTEAQQRTAQTIREAVGAWHESIKGSDPDFGKKADAMQAAARQIVAERGQPKTPDEAVQYAKDAYAKANEWLGASRPAPKATRPTPGNGSNGSRAAVTPQPTTLEEAIRAGLSGA